MVTTEARDKAVVEGGGRGHHSAVGVSLLASLASAALEVIVSQPVVLCGAFFRARFPQSLLSLLISSSSLPNPVKKREEGLWKTIEH